MDTHRDVRETAALLIVIVLACLPFTWQVAKDYFHVSKPFASTEDATPGSASSGSDDNGVLGYVPPAIDRTIPRSVCAPGTTNAVVTFERMPAEATVGEHTKYTPGFPLEDFWSDFAPAPDLSPMNTEIFGPNLWSLEAKTIGEGLTFVTSYYFSGQHGEWYPGSEDWAATLTTPDPFTWYMGTDYPTTTMMFCDEAQPDLPSYPVSLVLYANTAQQANRDILLEQFPELHPLIA